MSIFAGPRGLDGRQRRERGSALLEFPLVFGLILVPFGLLVISASTWVERQTAARDAAGEAARAIVVAGADSTTPEQIVQSIEAGYGLAPGSLDASIPPGGHTPGSSVTVDVVVEIPALSLPIFGSVGSVSWTASHTERYPDVGADR